MYDETLAFGNALVHFPAFVLTISSLSGREKKKIKKNWTHAESPIFMHISFTMKYEGILKQNLKISKKLLFFDSGYYTSLEMDQEHSEDVSINLSDHKITFFRF